MPPAVQMKADAIVVSPLTSIICNYIYHQSVYIRMYIQYLYIFSTLPRRDMSLLLVTGYVPPISFSHRFHLFIYLSVYTYMEIYVIAGCHGLRKTLSSTDLRMIADRITGRTDVRRRIPRIPKTGNLIPKSATKDDQATELTNSTKDSPSDSTPHH